MNNTEMQILIKLKDEASAEFQKMGQNVNQATNSMKDKLGSFGVAAIAMGNIIANVAQQAGTYLFDFFKSTIKAGADAQKSMASIQATLTSMGDYAVKNKNAILDAAEATMRYGFDNNDAALSITKFYQRTKDMTEAIKLNNVAMDLARAKNLSLMDATNLVNLALSGGGRVLLQYGIKIKDTAGPLEALQDLQRQVAGQAQAFSQTFDGQMQVLNANFQQIKETIGIALITALEPFIQKLTLFLLDPKVKENILLIVTDFLKLAEVIGTFLVTAWDAMVDTATRVWLILFKIYDIMVAIVDKAAQVASSLTGKVVDAWRNAGDNIKWAMGLEGRAGGGSVASGSAYVVGEHGPELFMPGRSGTIVPNGAGMGGGVSVSISGNFYGSDQDFAEKMANTIARLLGQNIKLRTY